MEPLMSRIFKKPILFKQILGEGNQWSKLGKGIPVVHSGYSPAVKCGQLVLLVHAIPSAGTVTELWSQNPSVPKSISTPFQCIAYQFNDTFIIN